jgi:hypothetical protein
VTYNCLQLDKPSQARTFSGMLIHALK